MIKMPFCAVGCVLGNALGWRSPVSLHYSIFLSWSEGFRYHMRMIVKFVFQAHFSLPKPRHILLLNEYFNLLISQTLQYWNLNIPCFPLKPQMYFSWGFPCSCSCHLLWSEGLHNLKFLCWNPIPWGEGF